MISIGYLLSQKVQRFKILPLPGSKQKFRIFGSETVSDMSWNRHCGCDGDHEENQYFVYRHIIMFILLFSFQNYSTSVAQNKPKKLSVLYTTLQLKVPFRWPITITIMSICS
jgi:hypothetical protein